MRRKFLIFSFFAFLFSITAKSVYAFCSDPKIPDRTEAAIYTALGAALLFSIFFISKKAVQNFASPATSKKQTKSLKLNKWWLTLGFSFATLVVALFPQILVRLIPFEPLYLIIILSIALVVGAIKGIRWGIGTVVLLVISFMSSALFLMTPIIVAYPEITLFLYAASTIIICLSTLFIWKKKGLSLLLGMVIAVIAWTLFMPLMYQINLFYFPPDFTGCGLPNL